MTEEMRKRIENKIIKIADNIPTEPSIFINKIINQITNGETVSSDEVEEIIETMKDKFIILETPKGWLYKNNE